MVRNKQKIILFFTLLTIVPGCVETSGELTADEIVNRSLARYEAIDDMTERV
jgi:outer membrane lipoprotein-sorting protein